MKGIKSVVLAVVALLAICPVASSVGAEVRAPKYSKEGIVPELSWRLEKPGMGLASETKNEKLLPYAREVYHLFVIPVRTYRIDSNNNGQVDLILREYDFPERVYKNKKTGEEITVPPYLRVELYINTDCDGEFRDRVIVDDRNEKTGKLGADGIFDRELDSGVKNKEI